MARISSLGDFVRVRTGKLDANAAHENGKYPFFTCSKEPLAINTYSFDCECVLLAGNGEFHVSYYSGPFILNLYRFMSVLILIHFAFRKF